MMTQFKTLAVVTVEHAYYSEACTDVTFIIPSDTARLLKNGKLLAKEFEGQLHLLFEADEAGAASTTVAGKTLRIGLQLSNPFFSNFTSLDAGFTSSKLFYRNTAAPATFDAATGITLVGQVFSHSLSDAARPVTVRLKDRAGLAFQTDEVTAASNDSAVSYDLTGQSPGLYTIVEAYPANTIEQTYYSDAELVQAGIFGVIELEIDSAFYGAAPELQIPFGARVETLKYYVVATNFTQPELNQLSVVDAGFTDDDRPQITFTRVPRSSFTAADISPDLLTDSSSKVLLFKSDTVVARTEKARKKIQLKKNGAVLITHLPQPGAEKPNADLIIPVSKP